MLQGLFIVAALLMLWFDLRHPTAGKGPTFSSPRRATLDALILTAIALSNLDLYPVLRATVALPGFIPSDASSHALIATHLFDSSLLPQWTDRIVGGFPLAIHYPMLGWLLAALPIKLGADPTLIVLCVGYLSVLSVPLLFYGLARRNGARVVASLATALLLQWLSPQSPFVGNVETFAVSGLLSQAVCMPILLLWGFEILGKGSIPRAMLFGILCVLAHPQLAASAALILGFAIITTGNGTRLRRYIASQAAAVLVAALVYGPGIVTMSIPFGWPDIPKWMHLGFGPEKLYDWLIEGALLDKNRPPLLTSLWLTSLLLLVPLCRKQSAARAAIVASFVGLSLCVTGPSLAHLGPLGTLIVSVFQPVRAMACVPLVATAAILVAFELYCDVPLRWFETALRWFDGRYWLRFAAQSHRVKWVFVLLCTAPIWLPVASTLRASRRFTFALWKVEFASYPSQRPCGLKGPSRRDVTALQQRIATLHMGRLWIDKTVDTTTKLCAITTGLERHASVPIAATDAVGAHVGLLHEANLRLEPQERGLVLRAEAMGIRYLLVNAPLRDESISGFVLLDRFGPLHLYERTTPTDYFGLGCTKSQIRGRTRELHDGLTLAFRRTEGRDQYLNPRHLTTIKIANVPSAVSLVNDSCRIDETAMLKELRRPIGGYAATVNTSTSVELVLRATAHPGFRFLADGRSVTPHLVSPGYYALTLGPGQHTVEATFRLSPFVPFGYALTLLLPLASAVLLRAKWTSPRKA